MTKPTFRQALSFLRRHAAEAKAAIASGAITFGALAHAELPPGTTDAVSTSGTDMVTVIGAMIAAVAAIWGLRKVMGMFGK